MLSLDQKKQIHEWYRQGTATEIPSADRDRKIARKQHLISEIARMRVASLDTVALLESSHGVDIDAAIERAERAERARLSTRKLASLESLYLKLGGE